MPHCENTACDKQNLAPDEVQKTPDGKLVCEECAKVTPLHPEHDGRILNREFDYAVGYTKKNGFQVHAKLGGAKISLEISQEEIIRIFGPEAS